MPTSAKIRRQRQSTHVKALCFPQVQPLVTASSSLYVFGVKCSTPHLDLALSFFSAKSLHSMSSVLCDALSPTTFPATVHYHIYEHLVAMVVLVIPREHVVEHHVLVTWSESRALAKSFKMSILKTPYEALGPRLFMHLQVPAHVAPPICMLWWNFSLVATSSIFSAVILSSSAGFNAAFCSAMLTSESESLTKNRVFRTRCLEPLVGRFELIRTDTTHLNGTITLSFVIPP